MLNGSPITTEAWQNMSANLHFFEASIGLTPIQGNDFFGNVTDHTSRRPSSPTGSSSSLPSWWRNLFGFLRFGTQPADVAPQSSPLQPRRWYLARDSRPTQTTRGQISAAGTEDESYVIGCCGLYLVRRRSLH
ncbi:hypothetical protein CY34DRAFT_236831 [Suillus luteus UH-Slu-Lm8-n1]|uniref:Uncharacterized protein n=1 Tax=Suillus luteus UH-Slu-Lm8-n1 TaxID=930992 RepID=A0A0D0B3F5_9AGAM|nr:hypothetical protein CY34DRAFT_236831 [Suillus luteus UH-Slu-Lm8-n1]